MDGASFPGVPTLTVSDSASQLQSPPLVVGEKAKVILDPHIDLTALFPPIAKSAHTCRQEDFDDIGTNDSVHTLKTSIMKTQCDCGCHSEVRITGFLVFTCNCDVEYITDIEEYYSLKDILKLQLSGSITDYGERMKCKHQVYRTRYIHRRGFCHCTTLSGAKGEHTGPDDLGTTKTPAKEIKVAYGCQKGCGNPFHYHKVTKETKEGVTPAAKAFYEREKKRTGGKEEGAFYLCEYLTPDCRRVQAGQVHYHAPTKSKNHSDPIAESLEAGEEKAQGEADGINEYKNMKAEPVQSAPTLIPRVLTLKKNKAEREKQKQQPVADANTSRGEGEQEEVVKLSSNTTAIADATTNLPDVAEPKVVRSPMNNNYSTTVVIDDTLRQEILELYDEKDERTLFEEKDDKSVPSKINEDLMDPRFVIDSCLFSIVKRPQQPEDNSTNKNESEPSSRSTTKTTTVSSITTNTTVSTISSPTIPPGPNNNNNNNDDETTTVSSITIMDNVNTILTSSSGSASEQSNFGLNLGAGDEKFVTPIFTNKDKKTVRLTLYQALGEWVRKKFYKNKFEYDGLFQNANFEEKLEINQVVNEYKGWFLRTFERDWSDPNYEFSPDKTRVTQTDIESLLSMGYNGYYEGEVYHELAAWLLIKAALDSTGPVATGEVYNYLVNTIANKMHTLPNNIRGFYFCPQNHAATQNTIMHVTNIKVAMCCKGALALPKRTNHGVPGLIYNAKDFL